MSTPLFGPYLSLLKNNHNYRNLFCASAISLLGDWFNLIAVLTLLGGQEGASAMALAGVFVIKQLPILFFSPFTGVVADKFSRRQIMIFSDLARAIVVGCYLLVPSLPSVWFVYSLILLQTTFSAFFEPARSALMPNVASGRELVIANALSGVLWATMLIFGSALGGLATEYFGWQVAMSIDSLSYLVSAGFVMRIKLPAILRADIPEKPKQSTGNLSLEPVRELFGYLKSHRQVLALALVKPMYCISGASYLIVTLFGQHVHQIGKSGAIGAAALLVARGIGVLSGPVIARRLVGGVMSQSKPQMRTSILVGLALASVSYLSLGASNNHLWALSSVLLAHMGGSVVWVLSTTLLQLETDNRFLGRVFGLELFGFTFTICCSCLAYGFLLDKGYLTLTQAATTLGLGWIIPTLIWARIITAWPKTETGI